MMVRAATVFFKATVLFLIVWLGLVSSATGTLSQQEKKAVTDFPQFDVITPNVNFWIDIFTLYGRAHGVIHDSRRLERVYGVIDLDPSLTSQAAQKNEAARKLAFETYQKVLLSLADGMPPSNKTEKQVAALFGPKATPQDFRDAVPYLRCQTGIRDQFRAGLIRSGAMIDEFKRIFISHGLPVDLVYLPCVESSFDYQAYSKLGAAGVWQFTRGTGKEFMEIDYVVDQRRDPYVSADAAARLLKRNHAQLQDWPMAITAYNHGLGGMRRAKEAMGTYENIFLNYESGSFKFASRNFYPEFLAARHVAKNYKKYFGDLVFEKPHKFIQFQTTGYLCAQTFTRSLQIDINEFRQLNPSLRNPVFNDQKYIPKGFVIRVPHHIPKTAALGTASGIYQARQKPSLFHVVKKGDTAGTIARTHNVSLNDLLAANGLDRRAAIYIGQNLRIPVGEQPPPPPAMIVAARQPDRTGPTADTGDTLTRTLVRKVTKPPQAQPAVSAPEPAAAQEPVSELADAPEITEVVTGEAAAVPVTEEDWINPMADLSNLKIRQITTHNNTRVGIIHVEAEETLGHYADWLQIPTRQIRALNNLALEAAITVNQIIKIPLSASDPARFEEKRFEFHREIEEDFFASFVVSGVKTYEIRPGDTIWSLCLNRLEIPFWLLKKFNPETDFTAMRPGQTLHHPVVVSKREDVFL